MLEKILQQINFNEFLLELIIAYIPFVYMTKRRKFFILRITACLIVCIGFSNFLPYYFREFSMWGNTVYGMAKFAFLFFLTLFSVKICFDCSNYKVIFFGIGAYSTQHGFYRLNSIISYYYRYFMITDIWVWYLTYWIVFPAVYLISYFMFSRKLKGEPEIKTNNKSLLLLMFIVLLVTVVLSYLGYMFTYFNIELYNTPLYVVLSLFSVIISFLALQNMFDNLVKQKKELEIDTLHMLWKNDRKQYEISKQNIDLLNIKYHDLKYQLSAFLKDEETYKEITAGLNLYDSLIKTGNETVDVVLTEKKLACDSLNIQLSCIVDGMLLNRFNPVDIYSLFGNAIDNAVECLNKIEDAEKKVINLMVKKEGELIKIQIENYLPDKLKFIEGLPVTTKNNTHNHGFGLKSIKYIVEKYRGIMQILEEDDLFKLIIIIPLA